MTSVETSGDGNKECNGISSERIETTVEQETRVFIKDLVV